MLRRDVSGFHFISTGCPKMAQSYVFLYRYSRCVIFQRPEILLHWWYLPESLSTFPYEWIPEANVCVIFFWMYMINFKTCKWMNESIVLHVEVLCSIPQIIRSKRSKRRNLPVLTENTKHKCSLENSVFQQIKNNNLCQC
jgi:hypothetical protein